MEMSEISHLLRFIMCGSVDDGKSSLIGRLLFESRMIFDDHLAAVVADSKKVGTRGSDIDLALLVDSLDVSKEVRLRQIGQTACVLSLAFPVRRGE
jgi:sulfate adenylyltransferase subunit 1 (EFTu-like GTPase family)